MAQAAQAPSGGFDFNDLTKKYDEWLKKQHPVVEVLVTGLTASVQGVAIGYMLGSLTKMDPGADDNPNMAQFKALQSGGPWVQGRNLGVLTGVNAGLNLAIKKIRGGKDDVWGSMGASFGSGVAFSLVSGSPNPLQSAFTTGCAFAVFNGLFYQIGQVFKPEHEDTAYDGGKYMLTYLGLQKYEGNLKKALLTDNTIMLWNESALKDANIPAGPRLLILHHVDQYRNPSSVLKPGLPVPMPPVYPSMPAPKSQAVVPASGAASSHH